ncbi:tetratricopeptide repeat protein [Flaviflagellibacter deserti]|uniref:Tetratricopeptide repeat protein n=1 Tax=Flaviflagellibacter deserti TaxID=2267266 RepID=A0ABV9Z0I7_9HYPH
MSANGAQRQTRVSYEDDLGRRASAERKAYEWRHEPRSIFARTEAPAPAVEDAPPPTSFDRLASVVGRLPRNEAPETPGESLSDLMERRLAAKRARTEAVNAGRAGPLRAALSRLGGPLDLPEEEIVDVEPVEIAPEVAPKRSKKPSLQDAIAEILAHQQTLDKQSVEKPTEPEPAPIVAAEPKSAKPAFADENLISPSLLRTTIAYDLADQFHWTPVTEPTAPTAPEPAPASVAVKTEAKAAPAAEKTVEQPAAKAAPSSDPMMAMEAAVERLATQFERTATKSFDNIENCLTKVMQTIENSRTLSVEAAEAAAERTIKESLGAFGDKMAARIEDIARGIADLRRDSNANESRTRDMLDAVRETLEQVAARLPAQAAAAVEETGSQPSLIERARAAAAEAAAEAAARSMHEVPGQRRVTPGAERQRYIETARRTSNARKQAETPLELTNPIRQAPKARPAAPEKLRGGLMAGHSRTALIAASLAAVMLGGGYVATQQLGGSSGPDNLAEVDPETASQPVTQSFTTAESGAPSSYRPSEIGSLPTDTAYGAEAEPAPVSPVARASGALQSAPSLAASNFQPTDIDPPTTGSIPAKPVAAPAKPAAQAAPRPVPTVATPAPQHATAPVDLPDGITGPRLRAGALAGDAEAQYEIGMRLADGRGVTRDLAKAATWFERAADQGMAAAEYRLGSMTEKGQGVTKDLVKARDLYERAASAGHVQAMHNLGVLYAEGGLGKSDMVTAVSWFRSAAERGVKDSQFNLGVIYTRGLGVAQDLSQAYLWFALAAAQGDKDAAAKRDQISAKLDQTQLSAAQRSVASWRVIPKDAEANEPDRNWDEARSTAQTKQPKNLAAR